jgi:hypothetical protein
LLVFGIHKISKLFQWFCSHSVNWKQLGECLKSKVSIPCCKQIFSIWAGQPTWLSCLLLKPSVVHKHICGGTCCPSKYCITVLLPVIEIYFETRSKFSHVPWTYCTLLCAVYCEHPVVLFAVHHFSMKSEKIFNASVGTPQKGMSTVDACDSLYCMRRNHTTYNCLCFHLRTCQLPNFCH